MPQLDLITISTQVSVMIFFGWGLFCVFLGLILPQYFVMNRAKYCFWLYLNRVISIVKLFCNLSYVHILDALNFYIKVSLNKILLVKKLSKNFSEKILKNFKIKKNIFFYFKIFIYKQIFFNYENISNENSTNIFGQKHKLNFFNKENSTYVFVQKYLLNFLNRYKLTKRKRKKIAIREVTPFWTLEDRIFLKNTLTEITELKKIFN